MPIPDDDLPNNELPYKQWVCLICGFIYDESKGWPRDGIAPGTRWQDVPEDWTCPDCLVGKDDFEMVELAVAAVTTAASESTNVVKTDSHTEPTNPTGPIVIIGAGYAGYNLAEALRNHNDQIEIIIITQDDGMDYSKPALSNGLANQQDADDLINEKPLDKANRLKLRIVTYCQVNSIDRQAKIITTNLGQQPYGQLVLATGAQPVKLKFDGNASHEVFSVNNLTDYRSYRSKLVNKHKVLLIGNGLIGCEFANDLADNGFQVDIVGLTAWPMDRQLPKVIGQRLQAQLQAIGVNWYLQNTVQSIHYVDVNDPSLGYDVTLQNGQQLNCDVIVSAIGLQANMQLAQTTRLQVGAGIQVNEYLATNDKDIFALGDCAEIRLYGQGQTLPYIAPIYWGIQALAKTLTGTVTAVNYPLMTVLVKTPACPLTVLPPPPNSVGIWEISHVDADGIVAKFVSSNGSMLGFALQGKAVEQRVALLSEVDISTELAQKNMT